MNKQEFIAAIEDMPDEATIFLDGGFINLIEADSVNYDPDQNIIVIARLCQSLSVQNVVA